MALNCNGTASSYFAYRYRTLGNSFVVASSYLRHRRVAYRRGLPFGPNPVKQNEVNIQ